MEELLKDNGMFESQLEKFKDYRHARQNHQFLLELCVASILRLCENFFLDEPSLIERLDTISTENRAESIARLQDDCKIELATDSPVRERVYCTGTEFYSRMINMTSNSRRRNAQFHVKTILLRMLYLFNCINQGYN